MTAPARTFGCERCGGQLLESIYATERREPAVSCLQCGFEPDSAPPELLPVFLASKRGTATHDTIDAERPSDAWPPFCHLPKSPRIAAKLGYRPRGPGKLPSGRMPTPPAPPESFTDRLRRLGLLPADAPFVEPAPYAKRLEAARAPQDGRAVYFNQPVAASAWPVEHLRLLEQR